MNGIESFVHDIAHHPGLKFAFYALGASFVVVSGDEHKLRRRGGPDLRHPCSLVPVTMSLTLILLVTRK